MGESRIALAAVPAFSVAVADIARAAFGAAVGKGLEDAVFGHQIKLYRGWLSAVTPSQNL